MLSNDWIIYGNGLQRDDVRGAVLLRSRSRDSLTMTEFTYIRKANFSDNPDHYPDEGCDMGGPSCLACILPKCRHEMTWSELSSAKISVTDDIIMATWNDGMTANQVAALHGITNRTVWRVKKRIMARTK